MKQPSKMELTLCDGLPWGLAIRENIIHKIPYWDLTISISNIYYASTNNCKPHLFPLSCLTEEITLKDYNDGKPFVPMKELGKIDRIKNPKSWAVVPAENELMAVHEFQILQYSIDEEMIPVWMFDLLNRWHFNTRGLDEFINAKESKVYE